MIIKNTKTEALTTPTNSEQPNYAEALRLLRNADLLLEKRKRQLRVQAMKARKGNWMEQ